MKKKPVSRKLSAMKNADLLVAYCYACMRPAMIITDSYRQKITRITINCSQCEARKRLY